MQYLPWKKLHLAVRLVSLQFIGPGRVKDVAPLVKSVGLGTLEEWDWISSLNGREVLPWRLGSAGKRRSCGGTQSVVEGYQVLDDLALFSLLWGVTLKLLSDLIVCIGFLVIKGRVSRGTSSHFCNSLLHAEAKAALPAASVTTEMD